VDNDFIFSHLDGAYAHNHDSRRRSEMSTHKERIIQIRKRIEHDNQNEHEDYYGMDDDHEFLLHRLDEAYKTLSEITMHAGHPDAAEGCRIIMSKALKVLE